MPPGTVARKVITVDNFQFETKEEALAAAVVAAQQTSFFECFVSNELFWFSLLVPSEVKVDVKRARAAINTALQEECVAWKVETVCEDVSCEGKTYIDCLMTGLTIQEAMLL